MTRHPRLYPNRRDPHILTKQSHPRYRILLGNLVESAEWCLEQAPRRDWIAPALSDPIHSNLYDRFYAIMKDLAVTEHLAFTYDLTGTEKYGDAAKAWVLASCRVWKREAEGAVDGGKAYAVSRLLKGIAVGYDLVYDLLSKSEAMEIRQALTSVCERYFTGYFDTPDKRGASFHTHHATVEWASFGIAALALLGEQSEADHWLEVTIAKFEDHLLPLGLAPDGAQIEGATFWASTMQYRLFFMDALERVTGKDLFTPFREFMCADTALAGIAGEHRQALGPSHASFILQPSYGQLDYAAPVLLYLAQRYRIPVLQRLALWDQTLGHIQQTRYVSPGGEQMLFELGGYACVWFDPDVPVDQIPDIRSWDFPSVNEVYARSSWDPGDLLIAIGGSTVMAHAGGRTVLKANILDNAPDENPRPELVSDDGESAILRCELVHAEVEMLLIRPGRCVISRKSREDWNCTCQDRPLYESNALLGENGVSLMVTQGELVNLQHDGFVEPLVVGNGLLELDDPAPASEACFSIRPNKQGEITVEIRTDLA